MAKRQRGFTKAKYEKWLKENRGSGEGCKYKPWLTIQDVPSIGKCSRLKGIKSNRQHEFFSNNETNYFYIVDFSDNVIDIKEQFPLLPLEQTLIIAEELGIKHPTDPGSKEPTVITTDFLLKLKDGKTICRTIKQYNDLTKRQIDKFEIERRYWEKKGISWKVVTERDIDKVMANNIELVYQFYELQTIKGFEEFDTKQIRELVSHFKKYILGKSIIREKASDFEAQMLLESGCGISIFKHLVITKQIYIDMLTPISVDKEILILEGKN